jgi:serine/threonine-protein kinase
MRREARAAARLCHPQVNTVYDFGQHGDIPYTVVELIDGPSLSDELGRGPLHWRRAVSYCADVASALAAVHQAGLVHRDVKPGNVMIGSTGAKLVDFGISAEIGESYDPAPDGTVLGTPAYVAPERLTGGPALAASDVYALGLLLYRALTGRLPWDVDTKTQLLRAHLVRNPAPLPRLPGMPEEVGHLIGRCLAKDPAARPEARQVARAWRRAAEHPSRLRAILPAVGRRTTRALAPLRGSRRSGIVTVGLLALVLPALLALFSNGSNRSAADEVPEPARAALDTAPACQVTYQLRTDDGQAFAGDLTLRNTGTRPLPDGTLVFIVHGDQQLTGNGPQWTQEGSAVRVRAASLAPGAEQVLAFHGTYHGTNPMPAQFSLGETLCEPIVLGVAGQPVSGTVATAGPANPPSHDPAPPLDAKPKKSKKPKN